MLRSKLLLLLAIAAAIGAFFALDLARFFRLDYFLAQRDAIEAWRAAHPVAAAVAFVAIYVAVTGLSLPGAAPDDAGRRSAVRPGARHRAGVVRLVDWRHAGIPGVPLRAARLGPGPLRRPTQDDRRGDPARRRVLYLFALRLVPLFPFFVINLAMGLTAIPARTFYWVSQVGMLPGTLVYVYAGTQLGQFRISGGLILAFVVLGLFPLLTRRALDAIRARRVYANWPRPATFDYNLVVIGAGSAGWSARTSARPRGRASR